MKQKAPPTIFPQYVVGKYDPPVIGIVYKKDNKNTKKHYLYQIFLNELADQDDPEQVFKIIYSEHYHYMKSLNQQQVSYLNLTYFLQVYDKITQIFEHNQQRQMEEVLAGMTPQEQQELYKQQMMESQGMGGIDVQQLIQSEEFLKLSEEEQQQQLMELQLQQEQLQYSQMESKFFENMSPEEQQKFGNLSEEKQQEEFDQFCQQYQMAMEQEGMLQQQAGGMDDLEIDQEYFDSLTPEQQLELQQQMGGQMGDMDFSGLNQQQEKEYWENMQDDLNNNELNYQGMGDQFENPEIGEL